MNRYRFPKLLRAVEGTVTTEFLEVENDDRCGVLSVIIPRPF